MPRRLLHVLTQRPLRTGSGVTLDALVLRAAQAGWDQRVVCALPAGEPTPSVGGLAAGQVRPLHFGSEALPFAIPGMSDVMPYASRTFASLTQAELARYLAAWRSHISAAVKEFEPQVIHGHHIWLVGAMLKELAPEAHVVSHCHGTGLRQLVLCPNLADRVRAGCARNDAFLALHGVQRTELAAQLSVEEKQVHLVGAGYRAELFRPAAEVPRAPLSIVFAGKLAAAKGLPWLLDAVERIAARRSVCLHVAGGGTGAGADQLRARMEALAPVVHYHGVLSHQQLAVLLQQSAVFVLPSMFEGLPLALIEAAACGCRVVATDLPGVAEMAPSLGDLLISVPAPRRVNADNPVPEDLPTFVAALELAIEAALDAGPAGSARLAGRLTPFTWDSVFQRVQQAWLSG